MSQDPYELLGVSRDADSGEIKNAYRRLAKAYHPDVNRDDPAAARRMNAINEAYEQLKHRPAPEVQPPEAPQREEPPRRRSYPAFAVLAAAVLLAVLVSCVAHKAITRPRYFYTVCCNKEISCHGTVYKASAPCR